MKLIVNQLNSKHYVDETIEFNQKMFPKDVLNIGKTHVTGVVTYQEVLIVDLSIQTDLILACAKTLKPVDHSLNFQLNITFGNDDTCEYPLDSEIDLNPIIFGHILLEKPMTVYHDSAKDISYDQPKKTNAVFETLKDKKKGS